MEDIRFGVHTRERLKALAQDGFAVVVPLAATEQHGPHLPVRTDTVICEHICEEAIRIVGNRAKLLMAPVIGIGCSEHHLAFGGTISFSAAVYLQMLLDIGRSLHESGFQRIIFLNGHGGNEWQMQQATADIALQYPVWTAAASYWNIARQALLRAGAEECGPVPGHAGVFETSMIMAIAPDEVKEEKRIAGHKTLTSPSQGMANVSIGRRGLLTGYDGVTDASIMAARESGEQYVRVISEAVAQWLIAMATHMDSKEG
ncbi:creatininase family protein [Paenibacillus chungangensis]|uniref:Creatininase family protein n=1 Tax=Paenibacillus chungangensis TaxID=696535 RepID=A0ABW3HXM1_9BACL